MAKQFWLMKSEPDDFSIWDLEKVDSEPWNGVRNYQARNFMRDGMKVGDEILFYHSNAKPPGIVGVAVVSSEPYADSTQFDKKSKYYDASSKKEDPRWILVDVSFKSIFKSLVSLSELKEEAKLETMKILQKGNRLSITPVTKEEFNHIKKMGNKK